MTTSSQETKRIKFRNTDDSSDMDFLLNFKIFAYVAVAMLDLVFADFVLLYPVLSLKVCYKP